jgi:hypothetical protein
MDSDHSFFSIDAQLNNLYLPGVYKIEIIRRVLFVQDNLILCKLPFNDHVSECDDFLIIQAGQKGDVPDETFITGPPSHVFRWLCREDLAFRVL